MKKNIDNYIGSIVHDNEDAIMNGWYSSIADYIIHNAENGAGWYEYFDDSETEDNLGEPTQEQIDGLILKRITTICLSNMYRHPKTT